MNTLFQNEKDEIDTIAGDTHSQCGEKHHSHNDDDDQEMMNIIHDKKNEEVKKEVKKS